MDNLSTFTQDNALRKYFSKDLLSRVIPALKSVENSIKAGKKNKRWFPHESVEGGTPTIAWGHKLPGDVEGEVIAGEYMDYTKGITDRQADVILLRDLRQAIRVAKSQLTRCFPDERGQKIMNDERYFMVLVLLVFNVGTLLSSGRDWGWPSLVNAMVNDDIKSIRKEMVTSYRTPGGSRIRLSKRAKQLADAIFGDQGKVKPVKKILGFFSWNHND